MADTTKKKAASKTKTKAKENGTAGGAEATVTANKAVEQEPVAIKKPKVRVRLDPNMYVPVRNGFHGRLFLNDRSTGETYEWTEFGDEIELTINTLQKVRSGQRRFFEDNWFLIDDPEVIEYLNVKQYYKNALDYEEFDTIFDLDKDAIIEKVSALSKGQQRGVAFMAKKKIESGELSDLNVIKALEDILNVELIEK